MLYWNGGRDAPNGGSCGDGDDEPHSELMAFARLDSMKAELYRAHSIEGADTVFVDAVVTPEAGGPGRPLRFGVTHAVSEQSGTYHRELLECEDATLTYTVGQGYRIDWLDRKRQAEVGPEQIGPSDAVRGGGAMGGGVL